MSAPKPFTDVTLVDPERMNLLGLMLGSMIQRRLDDARARRHAQSLRGLIGISAGGMQVTLECAKDRILVRRGPPEKAPAVRVRGTLIALLDAALGRRRTIHFLRGDLFAWGPPSPIWHLLSLMRVAPTKPDPAPD